jgi:hypothetical protein
VRKIEFRAANGTTVQQLLNREWLVTNGLGGYASGTISGAVTWKYHGLLIAALPLPVLAQQVARSVSQKKALTQADWDRWRSIQNPTLSNDGKWAAYTLSPQVGDGEFVVRSTTGSTEYRVPVGYIGRPNNVPGALRPRQPGPGGPGGGPGGFGAQRAPTLYVTRRFSAMPKVERVFRFTEPPIESAAVSGNTPETISICSYTAPGSSCRLAPIAVMARSLGRNTAVLPFASATTAPGLRGLWSGLQPRT